MRIILILTGCFLALLPGFAAEPSASMATNTAGSTRAALNEGSFEIKSDLKGVHPRMFFTPDEVQSAISRYKSSPDSFKNFLPEEGDLSAVPVAFTEGEIGTRNGDRVLRLTAAAILTRDPVYEAALKKWLPILEPFEPVTFKGLGHDDHDLVSGHVLFCLATSYDLLKGRGDPAVTAAVRGALIAQARATYAALNGMKTFPYEQNHFTIPVSGLVMAACVLADEVPEAKVWGIFGTNILRRSLGVLAPDGWFFEGFNYWGFTMQSVLAGAAALQTVTGEDFFSKPPLSNMPVYLAQMLLPNPDFAFDFSDFGPRVEKDGIHAQKGYEMPWHTKHSSLELFLPWLMSRLRPDPLLDEVMGLKSTARPGHSASDVFNIFWQMPPTEATPTRNLAEPYHYFSDMEVAHWRGNWGDPDTTAIAFKSGPPAGHNEGRKLTQFPEWKPGLGHAHPDAGTFTIFSHGVFLANGDLAYVGKKETANTNSLLVDGIGQAASGTPWNTFSDRAYAVYDQIHLADVWLGPSVMAATAIFGAAYPDKLQITTMERQLIMIDGRFLVIHDFIDSRSPHQYQWLFHGDQAPVNPRANRFVMENGPGRIVMEHLLPTEKSQSGPDVVETELYDASRSRPQQRGFHLEVSSLPGQKQFQFLVAMGIQSAKDPAEEISFNRENGGPVHLAIGDQSCDIWTRGDKGLDGSYGYVLRNREGIIVAAGVNGHALTGTGISLWLKSAGGVCLRLGDAGKWSVESSSPDSNEVTVSEAASTKPQMLIW